MVLKLVHRLTKGSREAAAGTGSPGTKGLEDLPTLVYPSPAFQL